MLKSFKILWPFLKKYKRWLVFSLTLVVPLAALRFSPAPIVKHFVDELFLMKDMHQLYLFPLLIMGIYTLNFVVRFAHYFSLRFVIAKVHQDLKKKLFDHLIGLSPEYFTDQSTGTLISRVGSDPQEINGGLVSLTSLLRDPLTIVFLLIYSFYLSWKLALVSFFIIPILGWIFFRTNRLIKNYTIHIQEENAHLFTVLQEYFQGIKVVKMFQLERFVSDKFFQKLQNYFKFQLKTNLIEELAHPFVEWVGAAAIAVVVFYGGLQVLHHQMTPGDLLAFFTTFAILIERLRAFNNLNIQISHAAAACDRIREVFSWKNTLQKRKPFLRVSTLKKGVVLKKVSFIYPGSKRLVLKNVCLDISQGEKVALVGESGAGKSTIVHLLTHLYDVQSGGVFWDGVDLRQIELSVLRSLVSVVSQDVLLFNDTLYENIRCGNADATCARVEEAMEAAQLNDVIQRLPQGGNALLGERGQKLSGGERQRVAIARAFLKNAPLLILDEATSHLDTVSEKKVHQAFEVLQRGRTALIIAHRLSTIEGVDRIFVLHQGKVVDSGTHEALYRESSAYRRFFEAERFFKKKPQLF